MRLTVFTAYYHLHAFALSPRVIHQRDGARWRTRNKAEEETASGSAAIPRTENYFSRKSVVVGSLSGNRRV